MQENPFILYTENKTKLLSLDTFFRIGIRFFLKTWSFYIYVGMKLNPGSSLLKIKITKNIE